MAADRFTPPDSSEQSKPAGNGEVEVVEVELMEPLPVRRRRDAAIDGLIDAGDRVARPIVRLGWRTARRVTRRLGVDRAVRRATDQGVDRALKSGAVERTTERALDSEVADRVWKKVLESKQTELLVKRVAEAPEVRSAIASQGVGLLEDVRRTARHGARRLDDGLEGFVRRLLRRPQRGERPLYAGGGTRLLAIAFDAAVLAGILLVISTLIATLVGALLSLDGNASAVTIAFGALAWWVAATVYLAAFWTLAERTPGMTFFGLRILTEEGGRVYPRQDIRRLFGLFLAAIPFGLGFLGILTEERRRGWQDRIAHTVVVYDDPELDAELPTPPGWKHRL